MEPLRNKIISMWNSVSCDADKYLKKDLRDRIWILLSTDVWQLVEDEIANHVFHEIKGNYIQRQGL